MDQEKKWPYEGPIFIEVPWNNKRVVSQRGYFTFHSNNIPLEEVCSKYVQRVENPDTALNAAARFLEFTGIHAHSVFPDLAELGTFLRKKYSL